MAQTYFKIVRVVRGSNFNNARSEIHLDIIIGNNGYFAVNKRQNKGLAH